jgi:GNAT superfamily N-acetyltransferase
MDDLDLLSDHRKRMWLDVHPDWEQEIEETLDATKKRIGAKLSDGTLVGFIVKGRDGKAAGSGCVWVREEQPRPTNPQQVVPYLMSMFTEKEYRHHGVATMIMEAAIKWCRENSYERIYLHASDEGKPLYESFGFEPGREMRLTL